MCRLAKSAKSSTFRPPERFTELSSMPPKSVQPPLSSHGGATLPLVTVESYNLEIRDSEGFIGDQASKGAFLDLVEETRRQLRRAGDDPLGKIPTEEIGKKRFDKILAAGEPEAAGVVHG